MVRLNVLRNEPELIETHEPARLWAAKHIGRQSAGQDSRLPSVASRSRAPASRSVPTLERSADGAQAKTQWHGWTSSPGGPRFPWAGPRGKETWEGEPAWTLRPASPHPARPRAPRAPCPFSPLAGVGVIQSVKPHRPGVHAVVNGAVLEVKGARESMSGGPFGATRHGQPRAGPPLTPRRALGGDTGRGPESPRSHTWKKGSLVAQQGHISRQTQNTLGIHCPAWIPVSKCTAVPSACL